MALFDDLIPQKESSSGSFSDLVPNSRRDIPAQELSLGERVVSALPKKVQNWLSDPSIAGVGLGKGSAINGVMMGAADPVVGAAQLVTGGQVPQLNKSINQKNAEYELAREGQGREGFDAARLVGNIASPANLAIAQVAPINAASTVGKVLQGARAGAIGGASAPVINADESYLPEKLIQAGVGGVAGGALTPVVSKAGEAITRKVIGLNAADASLRADQIMRESVQRLQRDGITLNQPDLTNLRAQVVNALKDGVEIDPAALFRKGDFQALGMQPTLGQITRDGAQFSKEKNLRGVAGVGEPLLQRFDQQAQRLQELITGRSAGAADEFTAGQNLLAALKGVDDGMKSKVNAAYAGAKDHLGRAAPMDSAKFSEMANYALDNEMLGGVLPAQVRNILNDVTLGKIPFNVNTAVQIDQTLSRIQRGASDAEKYAISKVRDALNSSPIADNVGEDAKLMFDAARGVAKNRFDTHNAIPALKAAVDGDISAQDFVRRFLINGKAEDVSGLAKVLPNDATQEARRQFGAAMERAAFGQNVTGDKSFSQESFAKFLNQPGMKQKLGAFFSKDEIAEFERISRVGAYMNSFPANSTVNTSNTAGAMMNLLSRVPGVPGAVNMLNSARNAAGNYSAVNSAMAAQPGQRAAQVSPEQAKFLSSILGYGVGGVAGSAGTGIGN